MTYPDKTHPSTQDLRVMFQGSVTVDTPEAGQRFYIQLKNMLQGYSKKVTLNGQLLKMFEPCCRPPAKPVPGESPTIPERRPNAQISETS